MSPVALSRIPLYSDAWIAEALRPDRDRQLFQFGEIAVALAREPGRLEHDEAERNRIAIRHRISFRLARISHRRVGEMAFLAWQGRQSVFGGRALVF